MKKVLLTFLKLGVPAAIFVYLLWQVDLQDYRAFWNQPKRWDQLMLAELVALSAIVLGIFRWHLLVCAFEIPFTVREALRLGFLGFLLNFVSFGSVGGDVFKAILVCRGKPQKRPEAVASVLLDRAFGLLGLVTLAWLSLMVFRPASGLSAVMLGIRNASGAIAISAIAGLVFTIAAGPWLDRLIDTIAKIRVVGDTLGRMLRALRLLRNNPFILAVLLLYSLCIHSLLVISVFLVSSGVYEKHPTLGEHFMVVPAGLAAGTLPLAPGGLGYQEGALAGLFRQLPNLPENFSGILVATIFRLVTIGIAGVGVVYYYTTDASKTVAELSKTDGLE